MGKIIECSSGPERGTSTIAVCWHCSLETGACLCVCESLTAGHTSWHSLKCCTKVQLNTCHSKAHNNIHRDPRMVCKKKKKEKMGKHAGQKLAEVLLPNGSLFMFCFFLLIFFFFPKRLIPFLYKRIFLKIQLSVRFQFRWWPWYCLSLPEQE